MSATDFYVSARAPWDVPWLADEEDGPEPEPPFEHFADTGCPRATALLTWLLLPAGFLALAARSRCLECPLSRCLLEGSGRNLHARRQA